MSSARVLLCLNAAVFIGYGAAFAVAPEFMSTLVTGGLPSTAAGLVDMRSTYGGMSAGLGLLLALAAGAPRHHRLGLQGVAAVLGGMGASRAVGLLVDGGGIPTMYVYLALEVVVAGLALVVLRRGAADAGSERFI